MAQTREWEKVTQIQSPSHTDAPIPSRLVRMFRQITSRLLGKAAGKSPGVWLGAFGKHPGWNDHMDDQGLETERLIAAKRVIYVEGVGAAIDSGAWEKLEPDQRLDEFSHEFIWHIAGDYIVGRMWSSRDGKGRTKYPLVAVAQCRDLSSDWIFDQVMPALAHVESNFRGTTSPDMVISTLNSQRALLRERARHAGREKAATSSIHPSAVLATLAARPEFAPDQTGLLRILYQIERDWENYRPQPGDTSRVRTVTPERSQHIRVPGCAAKGSDRLRLWLDLVMTMTAAPVPRFLVTPSGDSGNNWVDIVVGEPLGPQLFCLKASQRRIPTSSEIPYTMDSEFTRRMRALFARP